MTDIEGFLEHIRVNHVTRRDAEQLIGHDEVRRLIAENVITENPWTERLEHRRPTATR